MALGKHKTVGLSKQTGWSYEGKPITLTKKIGRKFEQPRHKNGWYSENTKVQAATIYAATRDLKTASELSGAPLSQVRKWKLEPWFQNVVDRCVKDNNDQLDAALTDIIHECKDQIKDRLKNGNHQVLHKTGEIVQVPIPARELTMTLAILFDKRQLIRGEATSRTESISADKRLEQLKNAFEQFSKATEIEGEYTSESNEQSSAPDESGFQSEESGQGQEAGQVSHPLLEYEEAASPDLESVSEFMLDSGGNGEDGVVSGQAGLSAEEGGMDGVGESEGPTELL